MTVLPSGSSAGGDLLHSSSFRYKPTRLTGSAGSLSNSTQPPPSSSSSESGKEQEAAMMARKEDHHHHQQQQLRAVAARAVTDSLRAAASWSTAAERAARFEDCVRSLEAEKAKMEVFRRELPISVHLVADVIEWLKEELAQHRTPAPAPELLAPVPVHAPAPSPAAKRKAAPEVKGEAADANDKRSWMSSAQLWTCGGHDDATTNGAADAAKPTRKVSDAFMPLSGGLPTLARSSDDAAAEKPAATPVRDLTLSSPAIDAAACPAAPTSATSSAVTDGAAAQRQHHHHQQAQQQQRKARRCWSPELHRRFVAALQRLGGAQVATPKQIRELMKVDGLTNDEVKSHLQKYRLHTRRASSSDDHHAVAAAAGMWSSPEQQQQYTTSQQSTSQSGSPQGPLQLTVSSRAMSVTAGDSSCDGVDEAEGGGRSESYSFGMQKASSS